MYSQDIKGGLVICGIWEWPIASSRTNTIRVNFYANGYWGSLETMYDGTHRSNVIGPDKISLKFQNMILDTKG